MKTWNVLTGVVQLVQAETAEDAVRIAEGRVWTAVNAFGDVYEGMSDLAHNANPRYELAIESEDQE